MNEIPLSAVIAVDVLTRARALDPEAFAAVNTHSHVVTSARRIAAIDAARAELAKAQC